MITMTRRLGHAAAVGALGAMGCFQLARTAPPVQRYVLGGARMELVDPSRGASAGLALGLRRLDLAPYLASLAVVVRRADNEIVTSGFHRWAEGPSAGLNRAVAGYLMRSPGIGSVDEAPWPVHTAHDFVVQLRIARFEGVAPAAVGATKGEVHLVARWEIQRADDGGLVARGATDVRTSGWVVDDYPGLVAHLDEGLVALTRELVACLAQLPRVAPRDSASARPAPRAPIVCLMRAAPPP